MSAFKRQLSEHFIIKVAYSCKTGEGYIYKIFKSVSYQLQWCKLLLRNENYIARLENQEKCLLEVPPN